MKSVGEYPLPEASVNSVNSVGELMLVHECLVGALETSAPPKRVAWVWQDAIPSYDVSVGGEQRKEGMAECHALL